MDPDRIIIDSFKGIGFVDVYVRKSGKLVEIEQGVIFSKSHGLIDKFKREYGIYKSLYVEFDENEVEISRVEEDL